MAGNILGLEIRPEGPAAVVLHSGRRAKKVVEWGSGTFPEDALMPGFHHLNVKAPELFVQILRDLFETFSAVPRRVSVALPDTTGLVSLISLKENPASYLEGIEILRWQLKDQLPEGDERDLDIDYQILRQSDSGTTQLLVAAVRSEVIRQYRSLLERVGLNPLVIDFHTPALYNACCDSEQLGPDFVFTASEASQFSLLVVKDSIPVYYRTRQIAPDVDTMFSELNRSLVEPRQLSGFSQLPVHVHCGQHTEMLEEAFAEAFEQPISWLATPLTAPLFSKSPPDLATREMLLPAFGMAERLTRRFRS